MDGGENPTAQSTAATCSSCTPFPVLTHHCPKWGAASPWRRAPSFSTPPVTRCLVWQKGNSSYRKRMAKGELGRQQFPHKQRLHSSPCTPASPTEGGHGNLTRALSSRGAVTFSTQQTKQFQSTSLSPTLCNPQNCMDAAPWAGPKGHHLQPHCHPKRQLCWAPVLQGDVETRCNLPPPPCRVLRLCCSGKTSFGNCNLRRGHQRPAAGLNGAIMRPLQRAAHVFLVDFPDLTGEM